mmetsp:Transcript_1173/g.1603  ORF Transcript_1173/g.1603 Transcript_1173/m.1603 type:complete len:102 (+) Transcript_1173:701-1006(+)
MNEYANQPIVLPVMKAHGVQFRFPNDPDLIAVNSDLIGAEKVRVDKMHPMVGATYSARMKPDDGESLIVLLLRCYLLRWCVKIVLTSAAAVTDVLLCVVLG